MESIETFLWKYIIGPIVADAQNSTEAVWEGVVAQTGYNPYNTLAWGILAAGVIFLSYRLFQNYDTEFDTQTVIYSTPFVILGGLLRFIEDTGVLPFEASLLLITPVIYFFISLVYLSAVFGSEKLAENYDLARNKALFYIGTLLLLPPFVYSIYTLFAFKPDMMLPLATLLISGVLTAAYYFLVQGTAYDRGEYHLAVFSQLFGGTASMIAVRQGYEQKQLIAQHSTEIFGSPGILIFKAGIAALAVYALKDVEDEKTRALTILVLTVIGIATGLRVLLRTTAGI